MNTQLKLHQRPLDTLVTLLLGYFSKRQKSNLKQDKPEITIFP